jgi:hypothetical protein
MMYNQMIYKQQIQIQVQQKQITMTLIIQH